jgi:hypothetical protein
VKVEIVMQIRCGATVIMDGKRYKVTAVGVRGCEGTKWHSNSPIEYYIESNGKELIAVLKQKERL